MVNKPAPVDLPTDRRLTSKPRLGISQAHSKPAQFADSKKSEQHKALIF